MKRGASLSFWEKGEGGREKGKTYAMLLAGLGLMGVIGRRRKGMGVQAA